MKVVLASVGNPDFRQDPTRSLPGVGNLVVPVADFEAASEACLAYIAENDLGGGNWAGGLIINESGVELGRVSYNGRVWPPGDYKINAKPLYDPRKSEPEADPYAFESVTIDVPGYGSVVVSGCLRVASVKSVPGEFMVNGVPHEFMDNVFVEELGRVSMLKSRMALYSSGDINQTSPVTNKLWGALTTAVTEFFASPEGQAMTLRNEIVDQKRDVAVNERNIGFKIAEIAQMQTAKAECESAIIRAENKLAEIESGLAPKF